ncbi:unnamed protein product [Ascophyllum nodosum]
MAPNSKKPRTPKPIRDSTFLDDPSAYPEFLELTSKLPALHTFRLGFHKNRTTSLLPIIAISMALSGVSRPPLSAAPAAWLDYLKSALYTDRLADHFEGFPSALAVMATIAFVSILAYPLRVVLNGDDARVAVAPPGSSLVACIASFGIPSATVWSITAWVVSRFAWGLASGLWVGLFATCTTLKITSFATTASSTPGKRASGGAADTKSQVEEKFPLTFREYIFFLFVSPSLVCDVRLMQASARRPSRPLRAASEFFHAVLTYLAAHCAAGSVIAPAMRMLVVGISPRWFEHAVSEWAELDAAGGGGWPSWALTNELLEGNKGPWMTTVCFLLLLMPLTSGACFLMFYAFWHCVCLGIAELWGFPDRDLYGCWWLVLDDPRKAFRMWSAPVHRWLAACVYKPMLQATTARHNAMVGSNKSGKQPLPESKKKSAGGNHVVNRASTAGWVFSVLVTFLVSIVFHEAIVLVAYGGAFFPFNTFLLTVTAALFLSWETIFPVSGKSHRRESFSAAGMTTTTAVVTASDDSCTGGNKTNTAIDASAKMFVFNFSVQLSVLIGGCAGWLLWRENLMK